MAQKVFTTDLKIGMFVADLDRPWTDTPFLLQGFLIEDDEQIHDLRKLCEWVLVDRARSVGDQFEAPAPAGPTPANRAAASAGAPPAVVRTSSASNAPVPPPPSAKAAAKDSRTINLEDIARGVRRGGGPTGPVDMSGYVGGPQ